MRKRLTIKGHPTRGKEVIELLEMLGGDNSDTQCRGIEVDFYYYIDTYGCINYEDCFIVDEAEFFTLEEFWEKFPFKIGDKVIDTADGCPGVVSEMKWDEDVSDMKYFVAFGNDIDFGWFANDSIEFCKENKNLEENKFPSFEPMFKLNDELEYKIPDGYEITEVSKNTVFIKPIKPKYPTTYAECCKILDIREEKNYTQGYKCGLICKFQELYIARNAYWKIAGEEMGLDKPWEPAIQDTIWGITRSKDEVEKYSCRYGKTRPLEFPTEEIRDIFYENFKELIEHCKELL